MHHQTWVPNAPNTWQIHDKCIAILVCYNKIKLLFGIRAGRFWDSLVPPPILSRCRYDCNLSLLETLARCIFAHEFEFAYAKLRLTYCDIYSSLDMGSECNNMITNVLLYLYVVTLKIRYLVSGAAHFGAAHFLRPCSLAAGMHHNKSHLQGFWSVICYNTI